MTNEQLKAALQSVGQYLADSRPSEHGRRKYLKNCEAIARHYLSTLATEADEKPDYAWAKTLPGALDQGGCCLFRCVSDIELWISDDEGVVLHRCGGELELDVTTRRAVRQLLAALQIPATKAGDQ